MYTKTTGHLPIYKKSTNKPSSRYVLIIFLVLIHLSVFSQNRFLFPDGVQRCKVRFELMNELIVIPVRLNGIDMSFILDTGSKHTLLFGLQSGDSTLAKNRKKIKIYGVGKKKYITGWEIKGVDIRIGKAVSANTKIYVISSDSFDMIRFLGKNIHGIIGYDLFKSMIVDVRYNSKIIKLIKPGKFKPPHKKKYSTIPLSIRNGKSYIRASVTLNGGEKIPVNLLVDTGNSDALWLFENEKIRLNSGQAFFPDFLGEGISGPITGKRTRISKLTFLNHTFCSPTASFLDREMTGKIRIDSLRDGSLGSQIWQRFRVIFDYRNQRLYLKKTKSFDKEFRYNRAGIHLIYAGKTVVASKHLKPVMRTTDAQNNVDRTNIVIEYTYELKPLYMVYYVRPDSPAELAGLKAGDMLVSINSKPVYNYKLNELNNFFHGDDGKKIRLIVKRNNVNVSIRFTLKKVL